MSGGVAWLSTMMTFNIADLATIFRLSVRNDNDIAIPYLDEVGNRQRVSPKFDLKTFYTCGLIDLPVSPGQSLKIGTPLEPLVIILPISNPSQ